MHVYISCVLIAGDTCMCPASMCSGNPGARLGIASFPGCFGREKRPGNFREFKLLLPLPESWKTQSDFRSLSHES